MHVFMVLRRNDRFDIQSQKVLVNPVRAISLVACQLQWPGKRLSVVVEEVLVGTGEQFLQGRRLVCLAGGEMKVEWMTVRIAEQMDFGRKPAARTP